MIFTLGQQCLNVNFCTATLYHFVFCSNFFILQFQDHVYRDRAAERRALHGGFGIGPEQKTSLDSTDSPSSLISLHPKEAAVESLSISFGAGSYARKILESMGWKEVIF